MRLIVVACALAVAVDARADATSDIDALVRANVAAVADSDDAAFDDTLREDAVRVLPSGQGEMDSLAEKFYGRRARVKQHTPRFAITLDEPRHIAWFTGTVDARFQIWVDGRRAPMQSTTWDIAGIALDDKGWKLAAIVYAPRVDQLPATAAAGSAAPTQAGDEPMAKLFGDWLAKNALAKHAAKKATALGPAKTTKTFSPTKIEATRWGTFFPIAFVKASADSVALYAIVVEQAKKWRWVTLGFADAE